MGYEFLDDMFERLLVTERKSFAETFEAIIKERVETIRDLGRVENAYQLFRKKHPNAPEKLFREYIWNKSPKDYDKCVYCFNWAK